MKDYKLQTTSIWKFPERGSWSTHSNCYRGNWSPHIPRNLILRYSKENDTILDMFVGSGTSLIEAKLLNRNGIGIDINPNALELTKNKLSFSVDNNSSQQVFLGDSRNCSNLSNNSIDLILLHPPYADIIKYSSGIQGDLSLLPTSMFLKEMNKISIEVYRLLKTNRFCSLMIADIRKKGMIIPLGFEVMKLFINNGFKLKEIIIKEQFNCKSTNIWKDKAVNLNFHLIAHEYIFIFKN